jgi:hypothetical protein
MHNHNIFADCLFHHRAGQSIVVLEAIRSSPEDILGIEEEDIRRGKG